MAVLFVVFHRPDPFGRVDAFKDGKTFPYLTTFGRRAKLLSFAHGYSVAPCFRQGYVNGLTVSSRKPRFRSVDTVASSWAVRNPGIHSAVTCGSLAATKQQTLKKVVGMS